jgi:hypothetical protein
MGCDIHIYVESRYRDGEAWNFMMHEDACYGDRNYELFSILAGVRNRFNITPISEPRGIPDDVDPYLKKNLEQYADHSFSWLTLKEIKEYKWDQDRHMSGLVSPSDMDEWKRTKSIRPPSWCQGTTSTNYTSCMIPYNPKDWCSEFIDWINHLSEQMKYTGANNVRLVFGFDN